MTKRHLSDDDDYLDPDLLETEMIPVDEYIKMTNRGFVRYQPRTTEEIANEEDNPNGRDNE